MRNRIPSGLPALRLRLPRLVVLPVLGLIVTAAGVSLAEMDAADLRRAGRHCIAAEKSLRNGDLDRAKSQYERALAVTPGHPAARLGLGNIMMMEQRFEAALTHYRKARDGFAEFGEAMFDIQQQQFIHSVARAQDLRDRVRELQIGLSNALQRSGGQSTPQVGQVRQAIAQTENEIQRLETMSQPSRVDVAAPPPEVYFYMGNAQFQLGRVAEAIESWETCRDLAPEFASVYNNLAMAYGTVGRFEDAYSRVELAEEQGIALPDGLLRDLNEAKRRADEVTRR